MSLRQALVAPPLSDVALIVKIGEGDLESLGALFDRHEPGVRRVLGYLISGTADIDDLVQLTFLQVIRAAPKYDPKFSVRSWLMGIAAVMARRHRRSLKRAAVRVGMWLESAIREEPLTPDEAFDSRETERLLFKALQRISPKRREALVLVAIEGTSGEEAAASLGIPLNTLWTRLHYARRDLRVHFAGET